MSPLRRRLRATDDGGCDLRLPKEERELLAHLPDELDQLLGALGPSGAIPEPLRRLFPTAHPRDAQDEAAYIELARADLVASHREALAVLRTTASASHLTGEELGSWLTAINEIRLVLGTSLDVSEDSTPPPRSDPAFSQWALYGYLSYLVDELVSTLSGALPPPRPGADEAAPDDPWGPPPGGLRWDGTSAPPSA